jgi:ABC-type sulfate transport system substrate-binding protein
MPSYDRLLQSRFTRRQTLLGLAATAAFPALASTFPRPVLAQDQVTLTLVAYSTPREAYEAVIPLFQETPEGTEVQFETSFAGSGEQSRAVEGGLPADIVALSLEPDITRLIEPGLVAEDWNADEYNGMVSDSVVVLAFRPGNPMGITTWDSLLEEGVEVITPNPLTSGGARWNVLAAYGAQLAQGKSEEEAIEYLRQFFTHVPVLDKSARESLATFAGGKGDVLIAY